MAIVYAVQLDRAETMMQEAQEVARLVYSETANLHWRKQMDAIADKLDAQNTISNIGPKLLQLMEKFGMTPALSKTETKGGAGNGGSTEDPVEDELAELRRQRGAASRAG